jgi:hypothetical protein
MFSGVFHMSGNMPYSAAKGEDIPESIVYQAASPDEFALVAAAKNFGFFFYASALSPEIHYI